jgi:hypothetical protein
LFSELCLCVFLVLSQPTSLPIAVTARINLPAPLIVLFGSPSLLLCLASLLFGSPSLCLCDPVGPLLKKVRAL